MGQPSTSGSRSRRMAAVLGAAAVVPAMALVGGTTPAVAAPQAHAPVQAAAVRAAIPPPPKDNVLTRITKKAKSEYGNASRKKANNKGNYNCNYYSGYWTPSGGDGCGSKTSGVRWRANEWCADFVWYVWRSAAAKPKRPKKSENKEAWESWNKKYAPTYAASFYRAGKAYKTYKPKSYYKKGRMPFIGSAVMFDWGTGKPGENGKDIDHVGIVVSTNYDKKTISTIEGNSNGQQIRKHTYKMSDRSIVGYMIPK